MSRCPLKEVLIRSSDQSVAPNAEIAFEPVVTARSVAQSEAVIRFSLVDIVEPGDVCRLPGESQTSIVSIDDSDRSTAARG